MSRSLKKGPYASPKLLKKVQQAKDSGSKIKIITWDRSSMVMPIMVGLTISVHDGRKHVDVFITEDMVGHKLGEFAPTTRFKGHGGKKAK